MNDRNPHSNSTRLPLENRPLERAVIGSLIADTQAFWNVKDRVRPELFAFPFHQQIVDVLHRVAESGRQFSVASIVGRLNDAEEDGFSPEAYLATLVSEEGNPSDLPELIGDLLDMHARRQMLGLGEALIRQAREDNGLGILERLDAAKAKVDAIGDPYMVAEKTLYDHSRRVLARAEDASKAERAVGLNIGLAAVQDSIGSLMPGRLYVLGAQSGMGKTALAAQIAINVSADLDPETGKANVVRFESLEMDGEELAERDLASRSGIAADKIERAAVSYDDLERLYEIAEQQRGLGLVIDSRSHQTVAMIRSKAMRTKRLKGLKLLVVDHILRIARPASRKPEHEQIREVCTGLKEIAQDLNIAVVALAQLKKEYSDGKWQEIRRPAAGDIYGGAGIENEADVLFLLHRPEYLLHRKEVDKNAKDYGDWFEAMAKAQGVAEIITAKRRGAGAFKTRRCYFDGSRTLFSDQPFRKADDRGGPLLNYEAIANETEFT